MTGRASSPVEEGQEAPVQASGGTFVVIQTPRQQNSLGGQWEAVARTSGHGKVVVTAGSESGAWAELKKALAAQGYTGQAEIPGSVNPKTKYEEAQAIAGAMSGEYGADYNKWLAQQSAKE